MQELEAKNAELEKQIQELRAAQNISSSTEWQLTPKVEPHDMCSPSTPDNAPCGGSGLIDSSSETLTKASVTGREHRVGPQELHTKPTSPGISSQSSTPVKASASSVSAKPQVDNTGVEQHRQKASDLCWRRGSGMQKPVAQSFTPGNCVPFGPDFKPCGPVFVPCAPAGLICIGPGFIPSPQTSHGVTSASYQSFKKKTKASEHSRAGSVGRQKPAQQSRR